MRSHSLAVAVALFTAALAPLARAAAPFQGTAVYRVEVPGKPTTGRMTVRIGPAGARTDMVVDSPELRAAGRSGMRVTTLVRSAEPRKVYLLSEAQRTYYVVEQDTGDARHAEPLRITRAGQAQIAGHRCEEARVEGAGPGHLEICLTRDLGPIPLFGAIEAPDVGDRLFAALRREGIEGLPVRWASFGPDGKPQLSIVLESATREPVPATVVALPEGYTQGDLARAYGSGAEAEAPRGADQGAGSREPADPGEGQGRTPAPRGERPGR